MLNKIFRLQKKEDKKKRLSLAHGLNIKKDYACFGHVN
jgi:hypothetical protein